MRFLRLICGPFFVGAGVLHFVKPEAYEQIIPPYLPAPEALVYASGIAEIAGGLGLMVPATRRRAGWWLAATMLAVFPANVHMAQHPERYPKVPGGESALKARLPLQAVLIAWVMLASRRRATATDK